MISPNDFYAKNTPVVFNLIKGRQPYLSSGLRKSNRYSILYNHVLKVNQPKPTPAGDDTPHHPHIRFY
jgi:hypothetical protein